MQRLAALAAVALLALLPACGAEDAAEQLDPVAEAADKTLAAGGAKMTGRGTFRVQNIEFEMVLDGAVNFQDRALRYEMDFGEVEGLSEREVAAARKDAGFPVTVVQDPETIYVTAEAVAAKLPGDKKWIKVQLDELSEGAVPGLEQIASANESNPVQMLRFLKAAGNAKKVGERDVRGTPTTEYRARVDLRKAAELVPEDERAGFRKLIDQMAKEQGGYTFNASVFIDRDGLIRREWFSFPNMKVEGERIRGGFMIDLHDFGRDITVEPPPGDEVEDVTGAVEDELE